MLPLMNEDWFARPPSAFLLWCLPLAIGFAGIAFAPIRIAAIVWTACFVWMGTACVLNARRCHRLHCYISGPVFFLGAVATGLLAAGLLALGPHAVTNVVSITLVLAILSFVPELVWRRYA